MTIPLVVHSDVAETSATGRLASFSSLLHGVYAASADPALWHRALDAIARAMGAVQALLFTPYVGPNHGGFFYAWNIKEQDLLLYASKYIDHDLWAHSAQRNGFMTEGTVAFDDELVPRDELLASVYYREFLSPMGVARLCSGVIFAGAPGLPSTVLSIYRGPHDVAFGQEDRELMPLLMPHLSRSLGLMHRLGLARHQEASMRAALDRLSVGVLLLDQRLALIHANTAGQQVLAREDGISLDPQRRLAADGFCHGTDNRLERWLEGKTAQPRDEAARFGDTFEIPRTASPTSYAVQCCSLEHTDPLFSQEGAHHIVFISDPQELELPSLERLGAMFGLTPAEGKVSHALVQHGNAKAIAACLGLSAETVRSQLKAIYAKTRVHDKVMLTRLVLSLSNNRV